MSRRGQYGQKYGFHMSNIRFSCGAKPMDGVAIHGSLTAADIDGAQPRRYTAERGRPLSFSTVPEEDYKSRYRPPKQARNPLDPQYSLMEARSSDNILCPRPLPPDTCKFLKDSLDISDIEGTCK